MQNKHLKHYLYNEDYFYSESEYEYYIASLVFNTNPAQILSAEQLNGLEIVDKGNGTWGLALEKDYVAQIGTQKFETLEEGIDSFNKNFLIDQTLIPEERIIFVKSLE